MRLFSTRLLLPIIIASVLLAGVNGCKTKDFNLRAIHDVGREYVAPDSTTNLMAWRTPAWAEENTKYWSSAGVIVTNEYNAYHDPLWIKKIVDGGFKGTILVETDIEKLYFNQAQETSTVPDCETGWNTFWAPNDQIGAAPPDSGSVDFAFVFDEDTDLYHIINIPGEILFWQGNPDYGPRFGHYTSPDLISWTKHDDIWLDDPSYAKSHVWAPHIVKENGVWTMFYTAVEWDGITPGNNVQRIMVTTSTDLFTWADGILTLEGADYAGGVTPFSNWTYPNVSGYGFGDCRDPHVVRNENDDGWLMFVSVAGTAGEVGTGGLVVGIATSTNLIGPYLLTDYVLETTDPVDGDFTGESPHIFEKGGDYYLQWSTNNTTQGRVVRTTTPSLGVNGGGSWVTYPTGVMDYKATEMIEMVGGEFTTAHLTESTAFGVFGWGFQRTFIDIDKNITNTDATDFDCYPIVGDMYPSFANNYGVNKFNAMAINLEVNGVKTISSGGEATLITDANDGKGLYFTMNVAASSDTAWTNAIGRVTRRHIRQLEQYVGQNDDVTYGVLLNNYNYRSWEPAEFVNEEDVDPADLGKPLSEYTVGDYDNNINAHYDRMVGVWSNFGIPVVVQGDRFTLGGVGGTVLESKNAIGVMIDSVAPANIDEKLIEISTIRSSYDAVGPTDPLLIIAGVLKDVYHTSTPTAYSTMLNQLVGAGVYFTPGADGAYFDYPATNAGDWWVRSDDDSNWQDNPNNPTYASYSVSPRQLMNIIEADDAVVLIAYEDWTQGGQGTVNINTISSSPIDVRVRYQVNSSASWLKQYYPSVEGLAVGGDEWIDIAYTTIDEANKSITFPVPYRTFHTDELIVEVWTKLGVDESAVHSFSKVFSYVPTPSPLPVRDEYSTFYLTGKELHLMNKIPSDEDLSLYDNLHLRGELFGHTSSGLDNAGANELYHENLVSNVRMLNDDITFSGYISYPRIFLGGDPNTGHSVPPLGIHRRAWYDRLRQFAAFDSTGVDTVWAVGDPSSPQAVMLLNQTLDGFKEEFVALLYELYTHSDNFVENVGFYIDWFETRYPFWAIATDPSRNFWPDYDLDGISHYNDADEQQLYYDSNTAFIKHFHEVFSEFPNFMIFGNGPGSSREAPWRSRLDGATIESWDTTGVNTQSAFEFLTGPYSVGYQDSIATTVERMPPAIDWMETDRTSSSREITSFNRIAMMGINGRIGHGYTTSPLDTIIAPQELDIGLPVGDPIVDSTNIIMSREYENGFILIGDYEDAKMGIKLGSADIWIEHDDGTVLYKYPTSGNVFEPTAIVHTNIPTININTEYKAGSFTAGELEAKADSLNGEILEPHVLWDDYYTQYGDYLTDIRVDDPDHILLVRFNTLYADTDWAILPVGSFYRDFYDLINDGDYWAKSSDDLRLSYNDRDGVIYPTRFIINITKSDYVEAVTDFYTDKLLTSSNALPYTGFLIDDIDYSNFSGRYCYGQNCGDAIDFDENGIAHNLDTNEQALYQSSIIDLVQTLRKKSIVNLQTKNIIIVDKGSASKDYDPLASIMDGTLFYNLNDGLGLSNNQTSWDNCVLQPTRYLNETLSNSMIIMDYSDVNSWDSALTSSAVVGGWASGNRVDGSTESKPDVVLTVGNLFGNPFYSGGDTLSLRYDSGTARLVVTDFYKQTSIIFGSTTDDTLLNVGWPKKYYSNDFDAPTVTDVALNCGSDITWYFTWQGLNEPAYVSFNTIVGGGGLTGDDYAGWSPYSAELYDTGAGSIAVGFTPLSDGQYVRGKIRFKDEVGNETFIDTPDDDAYSSGSAYGDSLFYGIGGCAVTDVTPPAVPSSFIATALLGEFNNPYVAVAWDSVTTSDLNYYTLSRGTTTLTYDTIIKRSIDKKGYTDTNVTPGTEYFYGLTSTDGHENESASATEVSATPVFDTTAPANPTGLADTPADGSILLDWDDNIESDLDAYNVYRGTVIGGPYSRINAVPVESSTYTDATVVFGTTYFYIVRAYDTSINESGDSNEVETTSVDLTPPPIPTGVTVISDANSATLDWENVSEVDLDFSKYIVYRSDDDGAVDPYVNIAELFSIGYTNSSLVAGNTYWYEITSVDIYGNESNRSDAVSTTITTTILPPVFNSFDTPSVVAGDTNVEIVYVATTSNPTNIKVLTKTQTTAYADSSTLSWTAMLSSHADQFDTSVVIPLFDGDASTTVTWTLGSPNTADRHEVWRQTDGGTWVALSTTVAGNVTTYIDDTATQAIVNYRVRAVGSTGLVSDWAYISTPLYNEITDFTTKLHASDGTNPTIESGESTARYVAGVDPNAPPNAIGFTYPTASAFFDTTTTTNVALNLEVTADKLSLAHWEWKEGVDGSWASADPQWSRNITPADTLTYAIVLTDTIRTTKTTAELRNVDIYVRVTLKDDAGNVGSKEYPDPVAKRFKRDNDGSTNWVGSVVISNHSSATSDSNAIDNWIAIPTPSMSIDFNVATNNLVDWGISSVDWGLTGTENPPMGSYYARTDGRRIYLSGGGGFTRNFPFFNFGPTDVDLIGGTVVGATLWIATGDFGYANMDTVFIYPCSEVGTPRDLLSEWVAGGSDNSSYEYSDVSLTTAWTTAIGTGTGDGDTITWDTAWFGVPAIFPANVLNLSQNGFTGFSVIDQVQTQMDNGDDLTFFMSFNQIIGTTDYHSYAGLYNGHGDTPANLRFYLELEIE